MQVLEETGLTLEGVEFAYAVNSVFPNGAHYVTVFCRASEPAGTVPVNAEPDKCEGWEWVSAQNGGEGVCACRGGKGGGAREIGVSMPDSCAGGAWRARAGRRLCRALQAASSSPNVSVCPSSSRPPPAFSAASPASTATGGVQPPGRDLPAAVSPARQAAAGEPVPPLTRPANCHP